MGHGATALTALGSAASPRPGRWKVEGGRPRCRLSPPSDARHGRAPAPGTGGGGARSVTWRRHFLCPCFALKAAAVPPAPRLAPHGAVAGGRRVPVCPPPHTARRRGGGGCGGERGRGWPAARLKTALA